MRKTEGWHHPSNDEESYKPNLHTYLRYMTFVHDEIDAMTQLLFLAAFAVLFIQEEASLWQQFHIMEFHCYWSSQLSTINSQRHKSK